MEVAGVALGVVPVAILAATTYRTLHDYLQILRASDTVANRVLLSLRCLELRLHRMFSEFLGDVLPDHDPWELFRNDSLTDQQKSAISIHVKSSLGPDSTTCEGVLKEISNIFDEVSTSLHSIKMAASDSSVREHGRIRTTKAKLNVALSHSQYKAELDELRKWINDLSDLLGSKVQHRTKSAQTSPSTEILPTKQTLPLPSSIIAINKASKQLGAGLKKAWTCSNTAHDSHCIALWLDAQFETDDVVHMDVAISCTSRKSARSSSSFSLSLAPPIQDVWLHIRSAASYPNGCEPQHCKRLRASTTSFNQDIPTAIAYPRDCCNASSLSSAAPTTIPNPVDTRDLAVGPRRSLQSFPSVCCHLRRDNFSLPMNYSKCCRDLAGTTKGYIGTPADHELLVLNHKGPMFASEPSWRLSDQSQPLTEHLNTLELLETVKVAYELTMGLLKFSNTEWLPNDWSLDDVSCLKSSSFDLGTLHVSQQLPHRRDRISIASEQDRAEGRIAASSARRTPLVSLAFVLLELAYHKPFVELKQDSDVDDIATARRLIQGIDMKLGNRFRSSIRMCLDGDFVVGCTDLSDGKVQTAVYNDVALKLDRLATDLEAILKLDD